MNPITDFSPAALAKILSRAGYPAVPGNTNSTYVKVRHDGKDYPAVLLKTEYTLTISCQVGTLGAFSEEELPLVALNALAANTEAAPYALSIVKPKEHGAEAIKRSPIILINSMDGEDLSEEVLLWELTQLQRAIAIANRTIEGSKHVASQRAGAAA
jgi:hypothetical protein